MVKTYKANCSYSITVKTASGSRCHVLFIPDSYGGSYYTTPVKEIQDALESSSRFNDMYYLQETREDANDKKQATEEVKAEEPAVLEEVNVTDIEEAREYLHERFGVAKRNMRSTASVKAIAEKNGILFVGI